MQPDPKTYALAEALKRKQAPMQTFAEGGDVEDDQPKASPSEQAPLDTKTAAIDQSGGSSGNVGPVAATPTAPGAMQGQGSLTDPMNTQFTPPPATNLMGAMPPGQSLAMSRLPPEQQAQERQAMLQAFAQALKQRMMTGQPSPVAGQQAFQPQ